MASGKEYLDYILEQLSLLEDVTYRPMMGEFILYYKGKIIGGIYDDWFLIKPVKSACEKMPYAERETPYEGAKEMLLVDPVEDREFLKDLLDAVWEDLPSKNKRPKKR
ncbi:MAG: competence protein TfoX [Erysipelotrichales bacterium]|nr:competence protein TfoX [Erysipelotrichales bacterium]MBQ5542004.1 competence protein TfoX [Erysipelotrichales bacterium]